MIERLPILIFDIPLCSFSRKISDEERQTIIDVLETGDIVLTSDKLFPLWQFAVGILGSKHYSHAAIYEGENSVIEATTFHPSGYGVARTAVNDFLSGRKNICVIRPAYSSETDKTTMFAWLLQQLGKPYDYSFSYNDNSAMYCAKLVAKAMDVAGLPVATRRALKYDLYLPDAFMQADGMSIIYRKEEKTGRKLIFILSLLMFLKSPVTGIVACIGVLITMVAAGCLQYFQKNKERTKYDLQHNKCLALYLSKKAVIPLMVIISFCCFGFSL